MSTEARLTSVEESLGELYGKVERLTDRVDHLFDGAGDRCDALQQQVDNLAAAFRRLERSCT